MCDLSSCQFGERASVPVRRRDRSLSRSKEEGCLETGGPKESNIPVHLHACSYLTEIQLQAMPKREGLEAFDAGWEGRVVRASGFHLTPQFPPSAASWGQSPKRTLRRRR